MLNWSEVSKNCSVKGKIYSFTLSMLWYLVSYVLKLLLLNQQLDISSRRRKISNKLDYIERKTLFFPKPFAFHSASKFGIGCSLCPALALSNNLLLLYSIHWVLLTCMDFSISLSNYKLNHYVLMFIYYWFLKIAEQYCWGIFCESIGETRVQYSNKIYSFNRDFSIGFEY